MLKRSTNPTTATPSAEQQGEIPPHLSLTALQEIGAALHDTWADIAGSAPLDRDDPAWTEIVHFVILQARSYQPTPQD